MLILLSESSMGWFHLNIFFSWWTIFSYPVVFLLKLWLEVWVPVASWPLLDSYQYSLTFSQEDQGFFYLKGRSVLTLEATLKVELYFWASSSLDSLDNLLLLSWPGGDLHKGGPQQGQSGFSQVLSTFSLWTCSMRICFVWGHVPSSPGTGSGTSGNLFRFMVSYENLVYNSHPLLQITYSNYAHVTALPAGQGVSPYWAQGMDSSKLMDDQPIFYHLVSTDSWWHIGFSQFH